MKILYINCVCGLGSTGRIVTDLMEQAKHYGHIVKVACSTVEPIKGVNADEVIEVGSKLDYYVHNALSRITDHEGLYSKAATQKLVKQIEEYDPDLIHLHNLHGHWINYEILFAYLAKNKQRVIWTLHDCWAFTGHCSYFSILKCEQWKTHCSYCPGLRGYPMCYGRGDVSKNYDRKRKAFTSVENLTIVTPSNWLRDMVRQSLLARYDVIAIPNGIDLEIFKPTESNFREKYGLLGKKIVLGVANVWDRRKGLDDLLALHQKLEDDYTLVLVGLSQDQIKTLPSGIIGITRTSNVHELVEIYSAADVFVNPSYEETMGLVTAEALACGTPAVVYDQTAVPEVVNSECGIVVHAGDIDGLLIAICDVINRRHNFSRTIARMQNYNKNNQYGKYLELYSRLEKKKKINGLR